MVGWMDNTLWQSVLLLQQQQPSSTSTTGATRKDDDDRRRRRRSTRWYRAWCGGDGELGGERTNERERPNHEDSNYYYCLSPVALQGKKGALHPLASFSSYCVSTSPVTHANAVHSSSLLRCSCANLFAAATTDHIGLQISLNWSTRLAHPSSRPCGESNEWS